MKIVFLLLGLTPILGIAETSTPPAPPPLAYAGRIYQNSIEDRFDAYLAALSRGYSVGQESTQSSRGDAPARDLGEVTSHLKQRVAELQSAFEKSQADARSRFAQMPVAAAPTGLATPSTAGKPPAPQLAYKAFVDCATRTLPLLKQRLQMQLLGDDLNSGIVDERLAPERGDGSQIAAGGVACGKYLGGYGFIGPGFRDEIKILSVFAIPRPDADEARRLFLVFLGFARSQPPAKSAELAPFWAYAWKVESFDAVFSNKPLPKLSDLIQSYVDGFQPLQGATVVSRPDTTVTADFSPAGFSSQVNNAAAALKNDLKGELP